MGAGTRRRATALVGALGITAGVLAGCSMLPSPQATVTVTGGTSRPVASGAGSDAIKSWDTVFEDVSSAVLRISTTSCDGGGAMGTGFLVEPDLVMTASHVIAGARTVSLQSENGALVDGIVIGADDSHDVALIRLGTRSTATPLSLESQLPERGAEIAVVGYPFGVQLARISQGVMSGLPEPVSYADQEVERAFTTDAATNGGNSGGPALNAQGKVIGLISGGRDWQNNVGDRPAQGTNYVIPGEDLAAALSQWRSRTDDLARSCSSEAGDGGEPADFPVEIKADDAFADVAGSVLHAYGLAITVGSYEAAYATFTAEAKTKIGSYEDFRDGLRTSAWESLTIESVSSPNDGDTLIVDTEVVTRQDAEYGPDGHDCSVWDLTYTLVWGEGTYLLQQAKGTEKACG